MGKIIKKYPKREYEDVIDEYFEIELDEKDIPYALEVPASELGLHMQEFGSKVEIKTVGCNKRIYKTPFKNAIVDYKKGEEKVYASYLNKVEITSKNGKKFQSDGGVGEIAQAKNLKEHHWLRDDLDLVCANILKKSK